MSDGVIKYRIFGGLIAAVVVGGLAGAISHLSALPEGPVAVAWDHTPCAHCRMHVGDQRFAVQFQTKQREILTFDDPGCALHYEAEHRPQLHAVWFRDSRADRWIAAEEVRFVSATETPMGFGIAAVDRHTPGAFTLDEARARVLEPDPARQGHGALR